MSKRVLVGLFVGAALGCFGLVAKWHHVSAAAFPCTLSAYGLAPCQGYFTGDDGTTTDLNSIDNVLPAPALLNVTDANSFISIVGADLASGDYQTRIGAAFIIDTMLNHAGFGNPNGVTNGVNYANANFGAWKQLVLYYENAPASASYGVNWDTNIPIDEFCGYNGNPPTVNSAYFTAIGDDAFHQSICPFGYVNGNPVIQFYWAGGKFDIGRPCGNIELSVNTIPQPTLSCGNIDVAPDPLDPYTVFSATVSTTSSLSPTPPGATMTLNSIVPALPPPSPLLPQTLAASGGGAVLSATFNGLGPTGASGMYTATWTLAFPTLGISKVCTGTFPVVYLPYLQVYGGDVAIGASPRFDGVSSSACRTNANAGIFSWNKRAPDFSGAGTQYAVQALAAIREFASAQNSDSPEPAGLSFANTYTPADPTRLDTNGGYFGGYYGATTSDCDFTSDIPASATVYTITTNPLGYVTIPATAVPVGTQQVIYAKDIDVFISGDITYQGTGNWTKPSDIPYFKIVDVGGDIFVERHVRQLDGIYVAEPDPAGGVGSGRIHDCAFGARAPASIEDPGAYSRCHTQLTINGVFIAKQFRAVRTYGSIGQSPGDTLGSNHSADVFNYTPEVWLPRGNSVPSSGYTSITSLPPVL